MSTPTVSSFIKNNISSFPSQTLSSQQQQQEQQQMMMMMMMTDSQQHNTDYFIR